MQKLVSTDLVQGGQYSVNIRVLPDNIIVTLSGEIENWTDTRERSREMSRKFLLKSMTDISSTTALPTIR